MASSCARPRTAFPRPKTFGVGPVPAIQLGLTTSGRGAGEEIPMAAPGPATHWPPQLKVAAHAPPHPLWEKSSQQLAARARHKLQGQPRRAADEEDVALSAFDS